ncbi:hypothetical protein GGI25_004002 [Coemansia spiralis]|uniref:Uncharacterized protein n=2 Tax=Coemansia TaxID=4863 RepID=A0A9W8KWZ9_9FUNG|nr:hypothetical protein EDC05_002340 [Coemansia umbellata]KAJ2675264.1 hypothetical protein GGI25_004002 [Coemansia spiralis]
MELHTTTGTIEHSLNWCRLCMICLTCRRSPKRVFHRNGCSCDQRSISHNAREVQRNGTTDFRFRRLATDENQGLTNLLAQMPSNAPPVEPNLVRANLCGTCQQRLRRAVDAIREPISAIDTTLTADFRRHRSIRTTIQASTARAATSHLASMAFSMASSTNNPSSTSNNSSSNTGQADTTNPQHNLPSGASLTANPSEQQHCTDRPPLLPARQSAPLATTQPLLSPDFENNSPAGPSPSSRAKLVSSASATLAEPKSSYMNR